jgi:hypothetical protein
MYGYCIGNSLGHLDVICLTSERVEIIDDTHACTSRDNRVLREVGQASLRDISLDLSPVRI